MLKEDKEEKYYKPMIEKGVDGVILEAQSVSINLVDKMTSKVIVQWLISTTDSHTNMMVVNFTQKLNHCRLVRVNQNRVKLKGLDTGIQKPKVDAQKLP